MNKTTVKETKRSKWFLGLISVSLLLCFASLSFAGTTTIYSGLDKDLVYVSGMYEFNTPVLPIAGFSKIRINAWGISGLNKISVRIGMTDAKGLVSYGLLDSFDLDVNNPELITTTRVYDMPGRFMRIYLQSTTAATASVIVYGR